MQGKDAPVHGRFPKKTPVETSGEIITVRGVNKILKEKYFWYNLLLTKILLKIKKNIDKMTV